MGEGGQRVGDPWIGFHNIFKVLWGKDGEILLVMYADILENRPLGCIFPRYEEEVGAAEVGVQECRCSNCRLMINTFWWEQLYICVVCATGLLCKNKSKFKKFNPGSNITC